MGVSDAGVPGARPGRKRAGGAGGARVELLPRCTRVVVAAGLDEDGYPSDSHRFAVEEPVSDFVWLFRNIDGTVDELRSTLDDYHAYVRRHGRPETRWRPATQHKGDPSSGITRDDNEGKGNG